jgi:polysaccharide export outer membrane protein
MRRLLQLTAVFLALAFGSTGCRGLRPGADKEEPAPGSSAVGLRLDEGTPYALPSGPRAGAPRETGGSSAVSESASAYRIRVGDIIVISLRTSEEQRMELIVDESGSIRLPLIDRVKAEGLTSMGLEEAVQKAYLVGKFYKYITVNIFIPSRSYYVRGEIRAPGKYPWQTGMTVMQAIASAGGFTDFAAPGGVQIMRGERIVMFNAKAAERDPAKDISIETGDVIVIPRSWY